MLVLSRRANEQIVLPDLGVTIEVISISGNRVKLGVTADQSIRVLRGEIAFEQNATEDRESVIPINTGRMRVSWQNLRNSG